MQATTSCSQQCFCRFKRSMDLFFAILVAFHFSGTANAVTLVVSDFDAMATGAVSASDLDGQTSGGSWSLKTDRNATYAIQDDGGDKALKLDDADGSGNGGTIEFATLTFSSTADFSSSNVVVEFRTATSRTGLNKALLYEFYSGGTLAASVEWSDPTWGGTDGDLSLNSDSGTSEFAYLSSWDADSAAVRDVSLTFSSSTVTLDFGAQSLNDSVLNSVTSIDRMKVSSSGSQTSAKGLLLDDITITGPASAPVAVDDTASTDYMVVVKVNLLGNDTGGGLGIESVGNSATNSSGEAVGSVSYTLGNAYVDYTPASDFSGDAFFSYVVSNSISCDTGMVIVSVTPEGMIFAESFEDPDISADADGFTNTKPTGWTFSGTGGLNHEKCGQFTTPYDSQVLWLNSGAATTTSSILTNELKNGYTYTLTFNFGKRSSVQGGTFTAALVADGTTLVSSESHSPSLTDLSESDEVVFTPDETHSALIGEALVIEFAVSIHQPQFDNVILTEVPLPPTGTVFRFR